MLTLLKQAEVFAPHPLGHRDLLLGGGRILALEERLDLPARLGRTVDAAGLLAVPGFVDGHVHLCGGGGEGGFATRTPELAFSDAVKGGVTTLVGCLGTDGHTRSVAGLLAKVRSLVSDGLSAWLLSGYYGLPPSTLTGDIETDLLYIPEVLGLGEVAISDHRSDQPTFEELARLAAKTRRGALLAGKRGLVNLHLGDGGQGLKLLRRLVKETELPVELFLPTHLNRNPVLFAEGLDFARNGGCIDLTTSTVQTFLDQGEVKAASGLRLLLESGVDPGRVTFSSDGQGSLPDFDEAGRLRGLCVGSVQSLLGEWQDAVRQEGLDLATALAPVTSNPARLLGLPAKGRLEVGADADLLLLEPDRLTLHSVVARGEFLLQEGRLLKRGTFEKAQV